MGIPVLIIGKSGSGKSTSLRNFESDEIGLINVSRKPLPFRKKFTSTLMTDCYDKILDAIQSTEKQSIVIDDAGYLIVNMFMRGHSSHKGNSIFGFYNKLADEFWNLTEKIKDLDESKIVYLIMHEDVTEFGDIKPKTIGKKLDQHVCVEGLFTICLRAIRSNDGEYIFQTQGDIYSPAKTPFGMFESMNIPNDLKQVDEAIRQYYEMEV